MRIRNSKELKVQSSWLCDLNRIHPHAGTLNESKIVLQSTTNRRQQDNPENIKLQEKNGHWSQLWGIEKGKQSCEV